MVLHDGRRASARAVLTIGSIAIIGFFVQWRLIGSLVDQGFFAKYAHFADEAIAGNLRRDRLPDLSPGYFWLTVFLRRLLAWDYPAVRTLQMAASALAAGVAGLIAFRFSGLLAGILATLFALGSRALLLNATELEPETWIALIVVLALAALVDHGNRERPLGRAACAGFLLGCATVFRPTALVPAILAGLWLFFTRTPAPATARARIVRLIPYASAFLGPVVLVVLVNLGLTGQATVMDPGTVFYEGMNPLATGYGGAMPVAVADIESGIREPDALHIAYRLVASRAMGRTVDAKESNRFWTERAVAFALTHPERAARLTVRKIGAAANSHDSWDLSTTIAKEAELRRRGVWLPFGVLLAMALGGALASDQRQRLTPLLLFVVAIFVVMVLFYVSARQRNPMIAPLAAMAGTLPPALAGMWKDGRRRRVIVLVVSVAVLAGILSIPGPAQQEDRYTWHASRTRDALLRASRSDAAKSGRAAAVAATWFPRDSISSRVPGLRAAIVAQIPSALDDPPRLFDLGVAAEASGEWQLAHEIFERLDGSGYEPLRGNQTVSSVAYHRARAGLRIGRAIDTDLIRRAMRESPGEANVLALAHASGHAPAALAEVNRLHDRLTVAMARARALADLGRLEEARPMLEMLRREIPEWSAPPSVIEETGGAD